MKKINEEDKISGGLGDKASDSDFSKKELKMGTKDEFEEHTNDKDLAKEIAKDHLVKDPNYYTNMKKNKSLDPLSLKSLMQEDDGTDPITLMNTIHAKDMRKQGFNWTDYDSRDQKQVKDVFSDSVEKENIDSEYVLEAKEPNSENKVPIETNNKDPQMVSTDPKFNLCPAFMYGFCRVNGRPCIYSNVDYKQCNIYYLATSGDPVLMAVPPGHENEMSYQLGIKA